jgi:spore maturation protein CgeB
MRIFYAVGSRPHGDLVESSIWFRNLYLPMVDLGHEVVAFDFDLEPFYSHADPDHPGTRAFVEAQRPILEAELLNQVARAHAERPIDVFFSYFYSSFVRPEVIRQIAGMGIVTVNWYCNASYQFHLVSEIAPAYSYCLVPEKFRLDDYRAVDAHPVYCQEAANPDFYRPQDVPREYDIAFVGSAYGDRPAYVRALLDAGLDAHVWGPGWSELARPSSRTARLRIAGSRMKLNALRRPPPAPMLPSANCGSPLTDDEMVTMFSRSKICLGFSSVGDTGNTKQPIRQVRLRDFEAPMSGAFYILEYLDEIEEFFVPGKEIVCFDGSADLVDKCRYYLDHEEEREKIRRAGHERALRDHTWQRRLTTAFIETGVE